MLGSYLNQIFMRNCRAELLKTINDWPKPSNSLITNNFMYETVQASNSITYSKYNSTSAT